MKLVLFVDGVSCVGKTAVAHKSLGFLKYLALFPDYLRKNDFLHLKYMYDYNISIDTMKYLDEIYEFYRSSLTYSNESNSKHDDATITSLHISDEEYVDCGSGNEADVESIEMPEISKNRYINESMNNPKAPIIIQRSIYSSIVYDILHKYGGTYEEPARFRERVDHEVFEDDQFCAMISRVWRSWYRRIKRSYPELHIELLWIIPTNFDAVVNNIRKRETFENSFLNIRGYVENQNYLFSRLSIITGVGHTLYVEKTITSNRLLSFAEYYFASLEAYANEDDDDDDTTFDETDDPSTETSDIVLAVTKV